MPGVHELAGAGPDMVKATPKIFATAHTLEGVGRPCHVCHGRSRKQAG